MVKKSLKKNAVLNIIRTTCAIIYPIITFPYASRILLPDGIGKVNFANSVISYFVLIAGLGIGTYGTREAAKIREDKIALSNLVKELFTINILSTLVAYFLLGFSLYLIPSFQTYRTLLLVSSITILFTTIGFDWVYSALEEYGYITLRTIIFQCISIGLLFLLVKTKEDYVAYLGIGVISSVGANILNCIHLRKYITIKTGYTLQLKRHLKPIFILFATSLAASIFTVLDTSMLGFLTNTTEVGYYTAAIKIIRMVRDLFPAIFGVLFARISFYVANTETVKLKDLTERTIVFIFTFSLPAIIGLILLMEPIILIFCGSSFHKSIIIGQILSPLIIISACSGFLGGQLLISYRKDKIYLLSMITAAVSNIILNSILIPALGAVGAGLATLIAELSIVIIDIIFLRDFLKQLNNMINSFIQPLFASLLMGGTIFFITNILNLNPFLQIIISIILGAGIYFSFLILIKNKFTLYLLHNILFPNLIKIKKKFNYLNNRI